MTRIKTRLQIWSALAALGTIASLAIPAVSALAEGAELAGDEQRAASVGTASSVATPSYAFPQVTFIQGLGWEIDTGGPAVLMRYLGDDD